MDSKIMLKIIKKVLALPFVALIRFYQIVISPMTPNSCRFQPTCSSYALEAIERFGVLKGGWLFLRRFVRCNPACNGGYDPVPKKDNKISDK